MKDCKPLPQMTPEQAGIPSAAISRFLDRIEAAGLCMHSFIVLRKGAVVAEGYWKPFEEGQPHRMYSSSKSVVSLAVGKMYDNKLIRLSDPITQYFPDKLPEKPSRYTMCATIRDLLMMATQNNHTSYTRDDPDWVRTFFDSHSSHMPGTFFAYDTAATTVLCELVERLTGKTFYEYLAPEFEEIGISPGTDCIERPEGGAWGGSGLLISTRDYAKICLLCQRRGNWFGKQLISHEYMLAATTRQIDNSHISRTSKAFQPASGYGYQFWIIPGNGFKFSGLGSQSALVFPEQDLIVATTADTQGDNHAHEIDNAIYEEILASLSDPLPEAPEAHAELLKKIESLSMCVQSGELASPLADQIHDRVFTMDPNAMGITQLSFHFTPGGGEFRYTNAQGECVIPFGFGKNVESKFPQKNYFGHRMGHCDGGQYRCFTSAAWTEPHKLFLRVFICDRYFGNMTAVFSFREDTVSVYMQKAAEWFLDEYQGFTCGRTNP